MIEFEADHQPNPTADFAVATGSLCGSTIQIPGLGVAAIRMEP